MWAERKRLTSSGKALGGAARVRTGEGIFMTWAVLQGVRGSRAVEGLLFPKGRIGLYAGRVRAVERKGCPWGTGRGAARVPWSFLRAPACRPREFSRVGNSAFGRAAPFPQGGGGPPLPAGDKGDGCEGGD